MNLHVCHLDKFIPPFIKMINDQFSNGNHQFWVTGVDNPSYPKLDPEKNLFLVKNSFLGKLYSYLILVFMLHRSKKIFLHGLFNQNLNSILAICPWLLSRCYWIMWGADLYAYQRPKSRLSDRVKEAVRRIVIRRFGHLVTYMPEEVELARKWYGARGEHHACQTYLSNVFDQSKIDYPESLGESGTAIKLLIGNSADPSNNHLEIFEKLVPFMQSNILIYVPLSYGDQVYAKKVIEYGFSLFKEKFIPLTSFIEYEEYLRFLANMDIAIFNHKRQQAIGNTTQLLGLGKKIYMRTDSSQWSFYRNLGFHVYDVNNIDLSRIENSHAHENSLQVVKHFSSSSLIQRLRALFD